MHLNSGENMKVRLVSGFVVISHTNVLNLNVP